VKYVPYGRTGMLVSELVLGAATFGDTVEPDAANEIVHRALDAGINTFDTGDVYAAGRSEEVLGRSLKGRRDSAILCTKVGARVGDTEVDLAASHRPDGLDHADRWNRGIAPTDQGLSRKHLVAGLDASLRRLGTDYIDIYTVHRFDRFTAIEEVLRTLDGLVRAGKVRAVACSGWAAWQLYKSLWVSDVRSWVRFEGIQLPINLLHREHLRDTVAACAAEDVSVLAFQVLAGGALTGRYLAGEVPTDRTRMGSRESYRSRYFSDAVNEKVKVFADFCSERHLEPAHVALRWTLDCPGVTSILLGVSSTQQVEQAIAGLCVQFDATDHAGLVEALARVDDHTSPTVGTRP
jgi:aryl-alcohol dehydrogenase-like predicted oxidoreductase